MPDAPETLEEHVIHDGPRFTVRAGRFRHPDGSEVEREWVDAPDAVAIVAYDDEQVYLVRQPREAIGRGDILELPAGLMDVEGEHPIDTARRELREETGLEAEHWREVLRMQLSNSVTDETGVGYIATGLRHVGDEPDETEVLAIERPPFREVLDAALAGHIVDVMTIAMLLRAYQMAQEGQLPGDLARRMLGPT